MFLLTVKSVAGHGIFPVELGDQTVDVLL